MKMQARGAIVAVAVIAGLIAAILLAGFVLGSTSSSSTSAPTSASAAPPASPSPSTSPSASASVPNGVALPNPKLTPGVASSDVTPADIRSTICVSGYTSGRRHDDGRTVRPPESYTENLKRQQIAQYGYADTSLSDYEEDHLIPLELGGDGYAPGNLWPEPYAGTGARVKDQLENRLHALVCAGQLGLREAQQAIAANWYLAYQRYVVG